MDDEQRPAGTADLMKMAIQSIERLFPNSAVTVLVAPFDGPPGARVNYISNANREDMISLFREILARFEARAHEAPKRLQ